MKKQVLAGAALVAAAAVALLVRPAFEQAAFAQEQQRQGAAVLPIFEVDPNFPTMPDHMLLGGVGGATADSHGNVWVFQRPHTLEEENATLNGYGPAPPFSNSARRAGTSADGAVR
jgi:hypothetical protein